MPVISNNNIKVNYEITGLDQLSRAADGFDKISKEEKDALQQLIKYNEKLKQTGKEGKEATDKVKDGFDGMGSSLKSFGGLLATTFTIGAITAFTKQIVTTTAAFEGLKTSIDFASGSQKEGAKNFQFLIQLANKYGKDLQTLAGAYSSFTAASNLAGISLTKSNNIFESAIKASAALGKSNEDTQGILLAFSQIVSKGTVQAEELRGQIGERIPGAFNLAAKAMGVTTQQLNKMLEKGEVVASEFLPKFAKELDIAFGPGAEKKVDSLTASIGRFGTAWDRFLNSPGIGKLVERELNIWSGYLEKLRQLTTSEEDLKKERALQIEQNITTNLQNELKKRVVDVKLATGKEITIEEAALEKYQKTLEYSEKADQRLANARIETAGSWNKVKLKQAEDDVKYTNLVISELEKILAEEKKLAEVSKETDRQKQERLKKEFDLQMNRLRILTEIRKIEQDTREGQLGADKAYYTAAGKLMKDFQKQGLSITNEEIQLNEVKRKDATEKLIEQEKLVLMEGKNTFADYQKSKEDADKKYYEEAGNRKLKQVETFKVSDEEITRNEEKALRERAQANQIYYETIAYAAQQLFQLQQANIQNELTLLDKRYSEEVRLAGDNQQKLTELNEKRLAEEKALRIKQFKSQQAAAIADVVFRTAPIIAQQIAGVVTAPLAIASYAAAAAQIAFIAAQPVPEFKEGTKGIPHKGGLALVGDGGESELVTTPSGKVFWTPATDTLMNLPKGSEVFTPQQIEEGFLASRMSTAKRSSGPDPLIMEIRDLKKTMQGLPIHQVAFDERGFTKTITRVNSRETSRNNKFPSRK